MRKQTKSVQTTAYRLTWQIGAGPQIESVARAGLPGARPRGSSLREVKLSPPDLKSVRGALKELRVSGYDEKMTDVQVHALLLQQIHRGELWVEVLPPGGIQKSAAPATSAAHQVEEAEITLRIAFQIAGGWDRELGISEAEWILFRDGAEHERGKTGQDGVVEIPYRPGSPHEVEIFKTRYEVRLYGNLESVEEPRGQQKRLDMLGYLTGYLRYPLGSDLPGEISLGEDSRGEQAVLNFQSDAGLRAGGRMDDITQHAMKEATGA